MITLIATGGTISCTPAEDGLSPAADSAQLARFLAAVQKDADVLPLMNKDSTDITADDMALIARAAADAYENGADGIIITHGTDTMAYTAAYLTCALDGIPIPVILTGSQLPFDAPDSDAPANLRNAFDAIGKGFTGVHILFGDKVLYGDRATKAHTRDVCAFVSPKEISGTVGEDIICMCPPPAEKPFTLRVPARTKVGTVRLTPYTTEDELYKAARLCPDGIVIEGFGLGGVPSRLLEAVSRISRECTVLLNTQCLFDGVDAGVYAVGSAAVKAGAKPVDMTTEAALARLMFLMI